MDDLDEIRGLSRRRGSKCHACTFIAVSDKALVDKFQRALAADIESRAISRWLGDQDVDLGYWSVSRHRKGDCKR